MLDEEAFFHTASVIADVMSFDWAKMWIVDSVARIDYPHFRPIKRQTVDYN